MLTPDVEKKLFEKDENLAVIVGCDEVGRGCLAGPVVAAALAFTRNTISEKYFVAVRDSKTLSAKQRAAAAEQLQKNFVYGIGTVEAGEIDTLNIHHASLLAMHKSIEVLHKKLKNNFAEKTLLLIDGRFTIPNLQTRQRAIIDGDAKIFSIAAASIIAKVYRDELMMKLHDEFPDYDFQNNKGYGTKKHYAALKEKGATDHHRKSFTLFHET